MAEITVPRRPNPWPPAEFGPLKLSERLTWIGGRQVAVRVLYVTRMVPKGR